MTTTANITPTAPTDGIPYSTGVPLTPTEADLGDAVNTPHPVPTEYGQAIVAVVQLQNNGLINVNSTYVVMQMDMGDGVWVDMNWALWNNTTSATGIFVFSNGVAGANTFQQSRLAGSSPASNGSNQMALGGRIRFVGKAVMTGGSSSAPGVTTSVKATITYKLLGLR